MRAIRVAGRDIVADAGDRIFVQGKASNNRDIGTYSTKPIYISKKNSPRKAGIEKESSYFFPGGYKQFKEAIGRGEKVNLRLFGSLQRDFLNPAEHTSGNSVTFSLKQEENIKKKGWAEEHFEKDIFNLAKKEEKVLVKTFEFELAKMIAKI